MSKIEKYGFVYIWYDKKHKRYYVGCHWGTVNDGYICSSNWMRDSYKRRPNDFKRRILKTYIQKEKLLEEEYKYISMIKKEELGKRYYNLNNKNFGYWNCENRLTKTKQKISNSHIGKKHTEETKEKLRLINLGKTLSKEHKQKIKENHNRDYSDPIFLQKMSLAANNRSIETRKKISENNKRLQKEGKIGMKNKKHSEETKKRISESAKRRYNTNYINTTND